MFDVHASGSLEMMRRTVAEVNKVCRGQGLRRPKVLAVTVLTSLNREDLKRVGVTGGIENQVVRLARLAKEANMDGVVASPHEIAPIRKESGRGFLIVTPGVRLRGGNWEDQKRVMTPEAAIRAGADYLVVGQPIREATDPVATAREIVAAMERGLTPADRRGRPLGAPPPD
jgi:orotidine-5'-phosphate decarboxylase